MNFTEALERRSLEDLRKVEKSDLHNHAGRGGTLSYFRNKFGICIAQRCKPFEDIGEMKTWFDNEVKSRLGGKEGYLRRVEASFHQAQEDSIRVLSLGFGLDEVKSLGGIEPFIEIMESFREDKCPGTVFFPELSLSWNQDTESLLPQIEEIFSYNWFKSIDLCGPELPQYVRNFIKIYRTAGDSGLKLRAHIGETGNYDDVFNVVETLELNEVHHGIGAAGSPQVMRFLADHDIQLNVCPSSNVQLSLAESYRTHPIRILYDNSVPLTINTDDLLIFNQSASEEYLNLYDCNLMTAKELNMIRERGLAV